MISVVPFKVLYRLCRFGVGSSYCFMTFLGRRHLCPQALLREVTVCDKDWPAIENATGVKVKMYFADISITFEFLSLFYSK